MVATNNEMSVAGEVHGVRGAPALPGDVYGVRGAPALPVRKRLNHRGPLSIDVMGSWYFITICAEGHRPWIMTKGRARAPSSVPTFDEIAEVILQHAREYHQMGKWVISLFLVMPDHLHCIVHVPNAGDDARGALTLPRVIANWKHWLTAQYGIAFQENFWDTRLRDEAQYAEKFSYICNNPVRKGLCAAAREWRQVIAFDRESGAEREHR